MIELAIIPARAGSVGLPRKNLSKLGSKPLIVWTINAALASGCFKRVVVSTDCVEIAEISRSAGAEVPFMRPAHLATSKASSNDVIQHTLKELGTKRTFALLQPTSPFRSGAHIINAVKCFQEDTDCDALISVSKGKPAEWQFLKDRSGHLEPILGLNRQMVHRRQDAQATYTPNGAIYLCNTKAFYKFSSLFPEKLIGYTMGAIDSIDIDDVSDLELAEIIVKSGTRKAET